MVTYSSVVLRYYDVVSLNNIGKVVSSVSSPELFMGKLGCHCAALACYDRVQVAVWDRASGKRCWGV